ncbi:MAG TPA: hypothetical protein VIK53_00920 [Verrucomicrobiae bacterium]
MEAGILACRRGRHLAARKKRPQGGKLWFNSGFPGGNAVPPGWKPRLYVSQDGRRYHFQTDSENYQKQNSLLDFSSGLLICKNNLSYGTVTLRR